MLTCGCRYSPWRRNISRVPHSNIHFRVTLTALLGNVIYFSFIKPSLRVLLCDLVRVFPSNLSLYFIFIQFCIITLHILHFFIFQGYNFQSPLSVGLVKSTCIGQFRHGIIGKKWCGMEFFAETSTVSESVLKITLPSVATRFASFFFSFFFI